MSGATGIRVVSCGVVLLDPHGRVLLAHATETSHWDIPKGHGEEGEAPHLTALRELALRRTADRVDEQMRDYRAGAGIRAAWPAADRLLVTVGPGSDAEHIVRAARRLAERNRLIDIEHELESARADAETRRAAVRAAEAEIATAVEGETQARNRRRSATNRRAFWTS